jgi:hypothetical protein
MMAYKEVKNELHISLITLTLGFSFVTCGSIPQVDKTPVKSISESIVAPDT